MTFQNRDARQRGTIAPELLATLAVTVIGVGAIGRQVALMLAAMGVPKLQLIDHDIVDDVNLATQRWAESDIGNYKVHALADLIGKINGDVEVEAITDRWHPKHQKHPIVMCCVDNIETRAGIYNKLPKDNRLFIDGRMAAMTLRVLTDNHDPRFRYRKTLFKAEEAYQAPCTSRSTIFTAGIAAGLMVNQMVLAIREMPFEHDLQLNLLAGELVAHEEGKVSAA